MRRREINSVNNLGDIVPKIILIKSGFSLKWWETFKISWALAVHIEKNCPRSGGHPPSRVNFSECLHETKIDPFTWVNIARVCSDCLALTELTQMGQPKCLYREIACVYHDKRVARRGVSPLLLRKIFVCHVNGSPSLVRKRRKSCLAQGSSGTRVNLLYDNFSPYKQGLMIPIWEEF